MRIRKNAARFSHLSTPPISSSSSSSNTLIIKNTHLNCVLNQSPWDIITFPPPPPPNSSDSSISHPPLHFQVDEAEFGCAGNGSFTQSIEAIYSAGSVKAYMESEVKLDFGEELEEETQVGFNKLEEDEDKIIKDENREEDIVLCSETNGKGWQCGRVVKKGSNVCGRHSKKGVVSGGKKSPEPTPVVPARRGRGRPRTKKPEAAPLAQGANAQDPHEFYYYSGFGPLWGKKKGLAGRLSNGIGNASGIDGSGITSITITKNEERKRVEDEEIEYMECDDDEDEDEEDEVGKKRVRKRIKARSLKSLM